MTFEKLKRILGNTSTESRLSDVLFGGDYFIAHIADLVVDDSLGAVLVQCDDGIWAIPYDEAIASRGFEQLNVRRAVKMLESDISYVLSELSHYEHQLGVWIDKLKAELRGAPTVEVKSN